jgi:hypothetical protein
MGKDDLRTVNVRIHAWVSGRFQFSQIAAKPNGSPLFIPMA